MPNLTGYKIAGQPGGDWMNAVSQFKYDEDFPIKSPESYGMRPTDNANRSVQDQEFMDMILKFMFTEKERNKYRKKMESLVGTTPPPPPPTPTPFTTGDPLLDEARKLAGGG